MTERRRASRRRGPRAVAFAVALAGTLTILSACATTRERWTNPPDPIQPVNRVFFGMNMAVDRYVATPIGVVYRAVAPKPIRSGVRSFFRNLTMPIVIVNDILQLRFSRSLRDMGRFVINTTMGAGGIVDPAESLGLTYKPQNFGVTAGTWGAGPGPYLVLPILGPTTVAGLPDIPMRILLSPVILLDTGLERTATRGANAVSETDTHRDAVKRIRDAVEPYTYLKSAYMQRQWDLIQKTNADEEPPFGPLPEDLFEDDTSEDKPAGETKPPEKHGPG